MTKENEIKNVLEHLCDAIDKGFIEDFDKNFLFAVEHVELYSGGDYHKVFDICEALDYTRLCLNSGCKKYFPELLKVLNDDIPKAYRVVINGMFNGDFVRALEIKCNNYTDMVRKYFNAVYKTITTQYNVDVYDEYTKEEITDYYNSSKHLQSISTLEDYLDKYVGKPKMSLNEFRTSYDIIKWYNDCKEKETMLYK